MVLLLSIESFAAVVGDNDGAAFITKAEFESLKNSFQAQIDRYNRSIDAKIDGAIGSYLEGIVLTSKADNLFEKVLLACGSSPKFRNSCEVGSTDAVFLQSLAVSAALDFRLFRLKWGGVLNFSNSGEGTSLYQTLGEFWRAYWSDSRNKIILQQNVGSNRYFNYFYNLYKANYSGKTLTGDNDVETIYDTHTMQPAEVGGGGESVYNSRMKPLDHEVAQIGNNWSDSTNNIYKTWLYRQEPNGYKVLYKYLSSYQLNVSCDIGIKDYMDVSAKNHTHSEFQTLNETESGKNLSGTTITIPDNTNANMWGIFESGERKTGDTDISQYQKISIFNTQMSDGVNYSIDQWGTNTSTQITVLDDTLPIESGTITTVTNSSITFDDWWLKKGTGKVDKTYEYKKVKYSIPNLQHTPQHFKLNQFTNQYLSNVAADQIVLGAGMPVLRATGDNTSVKIKLVFKEYNSDGTLVTTANTIRYFLSNNKFIDGAIAPGSINYSPSNSSTTTNNELTLDIEDLQKDQMIYVNCYSTTAGNYVILDSFSFTQN